MNATFENKIVNVEKFIEVYIVEMTDITVKFLIISLITMVIIHKLFPKLNFLKLMYFNALQLLVLFFKIIICIQLFKFVFFYDFQTQVYTYKFPNKMLVSSLFVGVLAFYEVLVGMVDVIKIIIDYYFTIRKDLGDE